MDRCSFYHISRNQRKIENERGLDNTGTMGYEEIGCFSCDGFDYECHEYFVGKLEYGKGLGCGFTPLDKLKKLDEI